MLTTHHISALGICSEAALIGAAHDLLRLHGNARANAEVCGDPSRDIGELGFENLIHLESEDKAVKIHSDYVEVLRPYELNDVANETFVYVLVVVLDFGQVVQIHHVSNRHLAELHGDSVLVGVATELAKLHGVLPFGCCVWVYVYYFIAQSVTKVNIVELLYIKTPMLK